MKEQYKDNWKKIWKMRQKLKKSLLVKKSYLENVEKHECNHNFEMPANQKSCTCVSTCVLVSNMSKM
jgi:hypothetical protein